MTDGSHESRTGPVPLPPPASRAGRGVPECHDDVCITCSDEALACRVLSVTDDALALVDTGRGVEEVSVALVDAAPGDVVLVHAKEAIATVDAHTVEAPGTAPAGGRDAAP